jgi:hypothetical protein
VAVQWLNLPCRQAGQASCFYSSSVLTESLVLRNPFLRQAPKRFIGWQRLVKNFHKKLIINPCSFCDGKNVII